MAAVSTASRLLAGRIHGLSKVASCVKYASTSTGEYASSVSIVINAGRLVKSKARLYDTAYCYNL
jgi:hypothetical protein